MGTPERSKLLLGCLLAASCALRGRPIQDVSRPPVDEFEITELPGRTRFPTVQSTLDAMAQDGSWRVIGTGDLSSGGELGDLTSSAPLLIQTLAPLRIKGRIRAPLVVVVAPSLMMESSALIDVTANDSQVAHPALPAAERPGQAGAHGGPGENGRHGGAITLILDDAGPLIQSLTNRTTSSPVFLLRGGAGGDGQDGARGKEGEDYSNIDPGHRAIQYYSAGWDHHSFNQAMEAARGIQGQAGGPGGRGGDGGRPGEPGKLDIVARKNAPATINPLLQVADLTPGRPGRPGKGAPGARGGGGSQGYKFDVRHCWKTLLWTDCKTESGAARGHGGHRGAGGANGADGFAPPPLVPAPEDHLAVNPPAPQPSGISAYESEATPILEFLIERAVLASLSGNHEDAAAIAASASFFVESYVEKRPVQSISDTMLAGELQRMRSYLSTGLDVFGEARRSADYVPVPAYPRILESYLATAQQLRPLRTALDELSKTVSRKVLDRNESSSLLPTLRDQIEILQRRRAEIEARLQESHAELAARHGELATARKVLDQAVEAAYQAELARASTATTRRLAAEHHARLVRGIGAVVGGILAVAGGTPAFMLAGNLVAMGSDIGGNLIENKALLQWGHIQTAAALMTEYHRAQSPTEGASRQKRLAERRALTGAKRVVAEARELTAILRPYAQILNEQLSRIRREAAGEALLLEQTLKGIDDEPLKRAYRSFQAAQERFWASIMTQSSLAASRLELLQMIVMANAALEDAEQVATAPASPTAYAAFHHQLRMFLISEALKVARMFANARSYERGEPVGQVEAMIPREALFDTRAALNCVRSLLDGIGAGVDVASTRVVDTYVRQLSVKEQDALLSTGVVRLFVAPRHAGRAAKVIRVAAPALEGMKIVVTKEYDQWLNVNGKLIHYESERIPFGVLSQESPQRENASAMAPSLIGWWQIRIVLDRRPAGSELGLDAIKFTYSLQEGSG